MSQVVLSAHGYLVLTATTGEKALELLAKTDSLIDLLITDVVMPGMNGRELIEKARGVSPHTKIVCSTGYAPSQGAGQEMEVLPKPFTSQLLLRKVKEVLAG